MKIFLFIASSIFLTCTCVAQNQVLKEAERAFAQARYSEALVLFKQSANDFQEQNNLLMSSQCELKAISCHLAMGDAEKSLTLATEQLAFVRKNLPEESQLSALAYTLLGESLLNTGRNDLALENLKKAEVAFNEEVSPDVAECFENLGIIYWNNGNLGLSTQYHEKALRIRQEMFGNDSELTADSYNNLGLINLGIDGFRASLYLKRAKSIYEKALGPTHPKVAFTLINLSSVSVDEGNTTEALELLRQAEDIWDQLYTESHPSKAFTLSNIGRVYAENEEWTEAEVYLKQALNMYQDLYGPKHPEVANSYFLLGSIAEGKRSWKEAIAFYQSSIYANLYDQEHTSDEDLPRLTNYYNADILLSSLIAKAKALEAYHLDKTMKPRHLLQSLETFTKCDTLISNIRQLRLNESDKIRLGQLAKEVYENAIRISLMLTNQPFAKEKYQSLAFGYCERSKSSVLLEAISETKAKNFAGLPKQILDQEDSLKSNISYLNQRLAESSGEENEATLKNDLFETERAYRALIAQIESDYPKYFELKYQSESASVEDIQNSLQEDEALLSYFEGDKKIYLFIIDQKGIDVIEKERTDNYQQLVSGLRNAVRYRVNKVLISSAQGLYDLLIPNLPGTITTLHFIPDGMLGTIPFEVLAKPTENQVDFGEQDFLLEDYAIGYDYSATLFLNKIKLRQENDSQDPQGILLTAPIDFEPETGMVSLAGTQREVNTIKYFFDDMSWNSTLVTQDQANESEFKTKDLTSFEILHFATHGLVHESKPELSRIYLRSTQQDDGILYSGEIYNLKIDAGLVTLSACETGLGKLAKGEGIVGLSRALLYAGAQNLIVSLWQVADQSTSDLMIRFYQDYLYEPQNFIEPLRQAKLSLLNSEKYQDPYYWAPFILIGS